MTKYAIAAGGNWNDDTTWSTTSGGANDTTKPTAADDVLLDAASGNVVWDTTPVARSINCTGYTGTLSGSAAVNIGDATAGAGNIALKFVAGMTYTATSTITFITTSSTQQTVDFAGKTTAGVTFNAASGGSWLFSGSHTVSSGTTVGLTKGTLNLTGGSFSWGLFNSSNANTRVLTMGDASITITGVGANAWTMDNSSGLTMTAAPDSTITFTGATPTFNPNGQTGFGTLIFTGTAPILRRSFTCVNLTRTGTATKTDTMIWDSGAPGNWTVTGAINFTGNSSVNRLLVRSDTVGTARTITCTGATVTVDNVDFQDVTFARTTAGGLDLTNGGANLIGDCGGNTRTGGDGTVTFTTPATQTATGTTSFTWSTHGWTTRVPLPQDDVVINNAFDASQTVTSDMPRLGKSISFSGATGTPAWANSVANTIYGSLTLISGMTISGTNTLTLSGRSTFTITSSGKTFTQAIAIAAPSGTYTLSDALTTSRSAGGAVSISIGTFADAGFAINLTGSSSTFTMTGGTLTASGIWTLSGVGAITIWSVTGGTLNLAGHTIVIAATTASTRTFAGGGKTYNVVTYTVAGSTGGLDITGANSFHTINFSDANNARTLRFTAATTTTFTGAGIVGSGSVGKVLVLSSITAATHTLTKSSGTVSLDWWNITNSIAQGGAAWYAGANSTDGTGNTGWLFTAPATAALTGTVTTALESDIVSGGKTIILTLTNDTWVASGATFDAQRQAIINGIDSSQAEATGWDAVVKAGLQVTDVARTSNTVVTITLPAFATYSITTEEIITATIPDTALTNAESLVASPTFTITNEAAPVVGGNTPGKKLLMLLLGDDEI